MLDAIPMRPVSSGGRSLLPPWACVLLAGVLTSAPLRAQTPPPDPPPKPGAPPGAVPPGTVPPTAAPAANPAEPQEGGDEAKPKQALATWQISLGLYGGYDSNIDFVQADGPGDEGAAGRLSITHSRRGPKSQFGFYLRGGGVRYQELDAADQLDGSGGLGVTWKLSPRSTLSLDGSGSYTSSDLSTILIASGVQLERSPTITYGGGFGLETRLTERTLLNLGGHYDGVEFEEPTLVDSASVNASLALSRRLGTRSMLGLNYRFLRTRDRESEAFDRNDFDSHETALTWSHGIGRRLSFTLAGGPGYAIEPTSAGGREGRWYYFGTLGLLGQIKRSTVNLQLRRSTNPAYGLGGNRLSYAASLALGIPLGRRVLLGLGGVHTWSKDPLGLNPALEYKSDDANATLTVTVVRRLALTTGYVFRRSEPHDAPAIVGHRANFGVVWTWNRPEPSASAPPGRAPSP
jgi:hypothetical protein